MAPSLRHRAALAMAGALIGAPIWGGAVAFAGNSTVTFSGTPLLNLGAVSCPSNPSISSLTVPAGTTVDFADRLGKPATLWAGDSHKALGNGEMVPVTFTAGPATIVIQMLPDCALDLGNHVQMTVTVTAPDSVTNPPVSPSPDGVGPSTLVSAPVDGSAGSGHGATAAPTVVSGHVSAPHKVTPSASSAGTVVTGAGGGNRPAGPSGNTQGTGASGNDDPFATPTIPDTAGAVTLGEPVGVTSPASGASGLLTLIATVCVVGVSAAAIRAIIAQRATRVLVA